MLNELSACIHIFVFILVILKVQTSSLEDAVKRLHRQEEITQLNQQARQQLER